jgi:hypothetical protein
MDAEGWLTSELATFGCAACGQAYGEERVRLIARREELFFVDLACAHCGSQAVAIVTVQVEDGTRTLEAGELLPAEVARVEAAGATPVSADDVLDVHRLLVGFEGGVGELLARLDGEAR